jgi:hypothetical protein
MTQQIWYRHTQRTSRRSMRWTEREREDLARMAPTRRVAPGAGDASALLLAHHTLCPLSHGRPPATPHTLLPCAGALTRKPHPARSPPACGLVRDRSTAARSTYVCLDHARHRHPRRGSQSHARCAAVTRPAHAHSRGRGRRVHHCARPGAVLGQDTWTWAPGAPRLGRARFACSSNNPTRPKS